VEKRLVEALERWPDILTDEFGAGFAYDEIVPCILENETYSLPVQLDGVYVYDWSALSRFFQEASFGVCRDHRLSGNIVARNRVQMKRIWAGDAPTADDLIAEMGNPHQFAVMTHHVVAEDFGFGLSNDTVTIDIICRRTPMTIESMAAAVGASPDAVIARLDEVELEPPRQLEGHVAHRGGSLGGDGVEVLPRVGASVLLFALGPGQDEESTSHSGNDVGLERIHGASSDVVVRQVLRARRLALDMSPPRV
jgi:hypothetical protein